MVMMQEIRNRPEVRPYQRCRDKKMCRMSKKDKEDPVSKLVAEVDALDVRMAIGGGLGEPSEFRHWPRKRPSA